jgi:hypothetical protein
MPRNNIDEPDPKSSDDERELQRGLDDRFDPDDPKAEDEEVTSRVSRDPARDIEEEELAEEDILEISDVDDDKHDQGPDA